VLSVPSKRQEREVLKPCKLDRTKFKFSEIEGRQMPKPATYNDCPKELRDFLFYMLTIRGRSPRTVDAYYSVKYIMPF